MNAPRFPVPQPGPEFFDSFVIKTRGPAEFSADNAVADYADRPRHGGAYDQLPSHIQEKIDNRSRSTYLPLQNVETEFQLQLSGRMKSEVPQARDAWETHYQARRMKLEGRPVVDLTIGDHDKPTDPAIINAMHSSASEGRTGYTDIAGTLRLRESLSTRIRARTGVTVSPEQVVVTNGGQAALFAAHLAVLNPGDKAICIDPYYPTYPGTIQGTGGKPAYLPARGDQGFLPDIAVLDHVANGARSILLNSPNNPSGAAYSRQTLEQIADIAVRHDLWVISDEVYDSMVWDGRHASISSLPKMRERTIVIGSMSKSFAMTGFRLGWLSGPRETAAAAAEMMSVISFGVSEFIQDAALHALQNGREIENSIWRRFNDRKEACLEALQEQDLIRAVPPSGGMYLLLDIRNSGLSGIEFARGLLKAHKIAVMPGESFGREAAGHIRLALCEDCSVLLPALRSLIEFAADATQ